MRVKESFGREFACGVRRAVDNAANCTESETAAKDCAGLFAAFRRCRKR